MCSASSPAPLPAGYSRVHTCMLCSTESLQDKLSILCRTCLHPQAHMLRLHTCMLPLGPSEESLKLTCWAWKHHAALPALA